MLDTIVILLERNQFTIGNPDRFTPSARFLLAAREVGGHSIAKLNPTRKDKRQYGYLPRLTLSRRQSRGGPPVITLRIEFSAPKLLFGNNFEELTDIEFEMVVNALITALSKAEIHVDPDQLRHARVKSIHYAKNIILKDGSTPHFHIQNLSAAQFKLSLDTNKSDYRNEGHVFKLHMNAMEIVFYDKVHDVRASRKSEKRSLEKDNEYQQDWIDAQRANGPLEVLRMEVRLVKTPKLREEVCRASGRSTFTLKDLFSSEISRAVLVMTLEDLQSRRNAIRGFDSSDLRVLLAEMTASNPGLSPKQLFSYFGLRLALEKMSEREIRGILSKRRDRACSNLFNQANLLKAPQKLPSTFAMIRRALVAFEPLRTSSPSHIWDGGLTSGNEAIP